MEAFIALSVILFLAVLPVFVWSKSKTLACSVAGCYLLFILVYRDFVAGKTGAWHDTFCHCQIWSAIIRQWVTSGTALGWNPYLVAGSPMAIFSNFFLSIPVFIFSKLFQVMGFHFDTTVFFNLTWLFCYFNFCTGTLLLLHLLFKKTPIAVMGFMSLLFGGLFTAELGEPVVMVIVSTLPYLLFFILYTFQTGRWTGLFFLSVLSGITVNHYIPIYSIFTLATFFVFSLLFYPRKIIPVVHGLASTKHYKPLLCLFLFLMMAAPAIYSYSEIGDFVSPARGFTAHGKVLLAELKKNPPTSVPLNSYVRLFDRFAPTDTVAGLHQPFYIGLLPVLFLFCGLLSPQAWIFLFSSILLAIMGLGFSAPFWAPLWGWMICHIPFFDMVRQVFCFSRIVTFSLLIAALFGCKAFLDSNTKLTRKFLLLALGFGFLAWCGTVNQRQPVALLIAAAGILTASAFLVKTNTARNSIVAVSMLLVFHGVDLAWFTANQPRGLYIPALVHSQEMAYPAQWVSVFDSAGRGVPFELRPITRKEIAWWNRFPEFMYMAQKDFANFSVATQLSAKSLLAGQIFHIVPRQGAEFPEPAYYYLQDVPDLPQSFFYTVTSDSENQEHESCVNAVDADPHSYWHVKIPKETPYAWLAVSCPFNLTITHIRIVPRQGFSNQLWRGDHAQLQASDDGKAWQTVQRLDVRQAGFDGSDRPLLFTLQKPLTTRFVRLFIDDPGFFSLATLELIDSARRERLEKIAAIGRVMPQPSNSPNRIAVVVEANQGVYLLRLENFHRGWRARIDGEKRCAIYRVTPNFQMVAVPKGTHTVIFEFHSPYPLLVSLYVYAAAAAWLLLVCWFWKTGPL
jgi:hypothetical protein